MCRPQNNFILISCHTLYISYSTTHEILPNKDRLYDLFCPRIVIVPTPSKVSHALLTVLVMKMYQLNAAYLIIIRLQSILCNKNTLIEYKFGSFLEGLWVINFPSSFNCTQANTSTRLSQANHHQASKLYCTLGICWNFLF